MKKVSKRINIFQWTFILLLFVKMIIYLTVEEKYGIHLLLSIYFDNLCLAVVFTFALCKIKSLAKKFEMDINICYMILHFTCVVVLIFSWVGDSILYFEVDET